ATMRPSRTATAWVRERTVVAVNTGPPMKARSAWVTDVLLRTTDTVPQPPAIVRAISDDESPARRSTSATTASAARVSTSMIVETAAISGRSPPRSAESTYTGQGVAPDTCTNDDTIVLSRLKVNDSSRPASTAGIASGRVILRKVRSGGAYRSADASSRLAGSPTRRARTM